MKEKILILGAILTFIFLLPAATALTVTINNGQVTDLGNNEILTEFGMIVGTINFKLGNLTWVPNTIWLLPSEIDPDIFSKNLTIKDYLQIPANITFSTCRTAVYLNKTLGYGFKIYNTATNKQILPNGTFCGLAYSGTYFVYATY